MNNYQENNFSFIGRIIFLTLFFFLISAFSDKSVKQDDNLIKSEFVSDLHPGFTKAEIIPINWIPAFQKYWVSITDRMHFKFSGNNFKASTDNKKTTQLLIAVKKIQLSIKPILVYKFCYQLSSKDFPDFPVLS